MSMMRKRSMEALILGVAVLASGCTTISQGGGPPTVMLNTPFGPPQVIAGGSPAVPPGGNLATPPPDFDPAASATARTGNRSGIYSGTAVPLDTAGGRCIRNQTVKGFRVHGDAVRWGRFRGTIAPDNGLQMVDGPTWVIGQFVGDTFRGQISTSGRAGPGCSYLMTLQKAEP